MSNRLRLSEIQLFERDMVLRMPFRFGSFTLHKAPQAFVRARVETEDGQEGWGMAAEVLAPKWFEKNPELSNEENFEQLRTSLQIAIQFYTSDHQFRTPFGLFAGNYSNQLSACRERHLNGLIAGYGPALLDRAVLDALCRVRKISFYEAVRTNLVGMEVERLLPEFAGFDFAGFLKTLRPRAALHARHTVGLVDPITAADQKPDDRVGDGLPETLEEVIATYGNRYFKIKVGGDVEQDIGRLSKIAGALDRIGERYFVTLDGNEQYDDLAEVEELWQAMQKSPALERFVESILFIEQPINRNSALDRDVSRLSSQCAVIIDESDADLQSFPQARERGYRGVSSKSCKGFYKSIINKARCLRWNQESGRDLYFMSGEDLTLQAGIAVQQDLALVSLIGLEHLERNGHHYVNGMAGLPEKEQKAFLRAHPDLYGEQNGVVRLRIREGQMKIGSLDCPGFASAAEPDWSSLQPMNNQSRDRKGATGN